MILMNMPIHKECFKCDICKKKIKAFKPAETVDSKLKICCAKCFKKVDKKDDDSYNECTRCGEEIERDENHRPVYWEGQPFHQDCFLCDCCLQGLGMENIPVNQDGVPWCQDCAKMITRQAHEASRCHVCRKLIKDVIVNGLGQKFHRHCVPCSHCQAPLMERGVEKTIRLDETAHPTCESCYQRPLPMDEGNFEQGGPKPWHRLGKRADGSLKIRMIRGKDLFQHVSARDAYVVFEIGLQQIYTEKKKVAGPGITEWEDVWEFRKIDLMETRFTCTLYHHHKEMGQATYFLTGLAPGVTTKSLEMVNGTLEVEFTWSPAVAMAS